MTSHHPFRSAAARRRYLTHYDARAKAWPVPSEEQLITTSWGDTFVRVSGPRTAPPLVLLPGAGATSLQWVPNIEAFSRGHRTYAVDNIYDVGRSVYLRRPTSAADFSEWLDELFEALGLRENVSLTGLSYGGWLTAEYALRHPGRLRRVVMIAPAGTVLRLSAGFLWRAILTSIPHRFFVRNLLYWFAEDSLRQGGATRLAIEKFVEDAHLALRSFEFKPMVPPRVFSDEDLASIEVPVLFLVGENEKLYSPTRALERLARVAPEIEARLVSEAGHDLTLVRAALVNRLILEFLGRKAETGEAEKWDRRLRSAADVDTERGSEAPSKEEE